MRLRCDIKLRCAEETKQASSGTQVDERESIACMLHLDRIRSDPPNSSPKVTKVTERSERRASERVPGTFRTVAPREVSAILRVMSPLSKPLVLGELLRPVRGEPAWRETEPPSRREGRLGSVLYCS